MRIAIALLLTLAAAPAVAGTPEGKAAWAAGDYARAVAEYRTAAAAGDAEAQFGLGEAYRLGRGVTADPDQALTWYRRAASLGNSRARDALGLTLFASGKRAEAMPLLEKAADGGDARALYILGTAHFNGDNTTRDWPLGYAMMMRAAASGLPQAKTSLEVMDRYLFPADKVKAQALYAQTTGGAPAPALASAGAPIPARPMAVSAATPVRLPPTPAPAPLRTTMASPTPPPRPAIANGDLNRPGDGATGAWKVQLGAFGSVDRANAAWTRLSGKVSALRRLEKRIVDAGPVQRLQAAGIADRAGAGDLCKAVVAAGGDCLAMAPEHR